LKNTTYNEVTVEGSIKQLKHLLKTNLVVKPPCLFDESIKVNIKVMYATGSKETGHEYSDKRSRDITVELSQI
jgi:hypothetical protein